jgi:hypothetical protein
MGTVESCPHCGHLYGGSVFGIGDGIGSPQYLCVKCKQLFNSGRREWADMGLLRRLWAFIVSLLLAAMFGVAGGYITKTMALRYRWTEFESEHWVLPTERYTWAGAGVFAGLVLLAQLLKVVRSMRRSRGLSGPHVKARFLSLHTNLFFWCFVLVVLYAAVGHRVWEFLRAEYWQVRW